MPFNPGIAALLLRGFDAYKEAGFILSEDYNNGIVMLGSDNEITQDANGDTYLWGHVTMIGYKHCIKGQWINNPIVILGEYNNYDQVDGFLIVGSGSYDGDRANCFRVTKTEVFGGAYNSTGADYAEMFEWADGNGASQDRVGLFVTLDGEKIRIATPEDDFILGVVSGNPSVVGDVHDDQWKGMYQTDIFGRPIWEDVEVPAETREETDPTTGATKTVVVRPAHTKRVLAVNPDYDRDQTYLPRSKRPEWATVGMMGKLIVIDDGTCQVNQWCTVGDGGVATASQVQTKYRVMARIDETHIKVIIL